jgi:hypothetical protein
MVRKTIILAITALIWALNSTAHSAEEGFVDLFNGTSIDQWRGYKQDSVPETWSVDEGAIRGSGRGPDLITKQQFGDFELRFEWKIAAGGNSGVIYRATEAEQESYQSGPEYQILDDKHLDPDDEHAFTATAALYDLYAAEKKDLKPAGEYNSAKIVVQGNRIEHWLNDTKVVECVIGSDDWQKKVAASKFAKWKSFAKSPRGHIVLQSHGSPVWFRNIRVKELTSAPAKSAPQKNP